MKDKFLEFAKTPLGTAIAIGLYCVIVVIYIVSKSKFGKQVLFTIREKVDFLTDKFKSHKEETEKMLKEQKELVEKELAKTELELKEFKEFVCETLKSVNNKKVKESIEKFELKELTNESEKVAE